MEILKSFVTKNVHYSKNIAINNILNTTLKNKNDISNTFF